MCGIVGMAGGLTYADEQRFKLMLLLDYFRGQDSTGVAVLGNDGSVNTLKVADDPIILMKHEEFEKVVNATTSTIFLGHNRASTVGASTRQNAHPFTHGNITGVHNGTLTKECKAALTVRVGETFATDSETVFAHINQYGIEDTIPRLTGAWAFVYIDSEAKTLNMIRNSERPLWICSKETSRGKVLQWASEYEMILAARQMTKDKAALDLDAEGFAFFPLPENTLHTWAMDDLLIQKTAPTCVYLEGKPTPPKAPLVTTHYTGPTLVTIPDPTITVEMIESPDPFGGLITDAQWDYIASYGCSYCNASVEKTDPGLEIYINEQIVLCSSCSGHHVTTVNGQKVT